MKKVIIKHRLYSEEEDYNVVAWHEDTTKSGNYVLTLETPLGRQITAIERSDLTKDQIKELKDTVSKDSTGL